VHRILKTQVPAGYDKINGVNGFHASHGAMPVGFSTASFRDASSTTRKPTRMSRRYLFWLPLLSGVLSLPLAGCGQQAAEENAKQSKSTSSQDASGERPKPVQRTSMEGNWVVQFSRFDLQSGSGSYHPVALIEIARSKEGTLQPRLRQVMADYRGLRIRSAKIEPTKARILFLLPQQNNQNGPQRVQPWVFEVMLAETEARGNVSRGRSFVPARFVATNETSLTPYQHPEPHEANEEFQQAGEQFRQSNDVEAFRRFLRRHPENPLSYYAVFFLNPLLKFQKARAEATSPQAVPPPSEDALRNHLKRLERYLPRWGEHVYVVSLLNYANALYSFRLAPGVVLDTVQRIEANRDNWPMSRQRQFDLAQLKQAADTERNLQQAVESGDDKTRDAAVARLQKVLDDYRYHPYVLYVLAEAARRSGDTDRALKRYAQLLVLPQLQQELMRDLKHRRRPGPKLQQTVEHLWSETHGGAERLDEFLETVYRDSVYAFVQDSPPLLPSANNQRRVLCELVTSSECRDCLALDLAVGGLQRTFPRSKLLVLRYHLAVPEPSPLTTLDSDRRASAYGAHEPPEVLFNGQPVVNVRLLGTLATYPRYYWQGNNEMQKRSRFPAPRVYRELRKRIERQLRQPPANYRLDVDTTLNQDELTITAHVAAPEQPADNLRLRFILAEDHIDYTGANEMRTHELVARLMPGGMDGLPLNKKDGAYHVTVDLQQAQQQLLDYLTAFEEEGDAGLRMKPIDFRNLHLVACIQNRQTGEILQVASRVVKGQRTDFVIPREFKPVSAPHPKGKGSASEVVPQRPPPPPLPITPRNKPTTSSP